MGVDGRAAILCSALIRLESFQCFRFRVVKLSLAAVLVLEVQECLLPGGVEIAHLVKALGW